MQSLTNNSKRVYSHRMLPRPSYLTIESRTLPNPSKEVMHLLRVYVCYQIEAARDFRTFSKDAIDLIARYLYRVISLVIMKIKSVLCVQRRTTANFFHALIGLLAFDGKLDKLLQYEESLTERDSKEKMEGQFLGRFMRNFINLFEGVVTETELTNIYSVPAYLYNDLSCSPVRLSGTLFADLAKPHPISYCNKKQPLPSENKGLNWNEKQSIIAETDIRMNLCRMRKIVKTEQSSLQQKTAKKMTHKSQSCEKRQIFSCIGYL